MLPLPGPLQIGDQPRSAARDFWETHHHWRDIKHWELTASMQQLDEYAIQNEQYFTRRFGFDAPREQRCDMVDIKNHFDLTDLEIAALKKSGLLTLYKGKPTSLRADRLVFGLGIYFVGAGILWAGMFALMLMLSGVSPLLQALGLGLLSLGAIGITWLSSRISFRPLRIMRQRGIRLGQKWVLREHIPPHGAA